MPARFTEQAPGTTRTVLKEQDSAGTVVSTVRRSLLPNGLRIITEAMPGVRSASIGVWVGTGSRDESPRLSGASHFLEHLLFKGTASRSALEISASMDAVGGEFNAFTAREYTCFHARVLDDDLPVWVPIPPLAEVQVALENAVAEVTGLESYELKKIMRTGTVATIDNRNWELRDHREPVQRFSQSRAIALDMESATIAANGFRFRVPYGTLLCVSDKPLHGELKLPGMASDFYRRQVGQHLVDPVAAVEIVHVRPRAVHRAVNGDASAAILQRVGIRRHEHLGVVEEARPRHQFPLGLNDPVAAERRDGTRVEAPAAQSRAATAAAEPPDEPPGFTLRSHGLCTGP